MNVTRIAKMAEKLVIDNSPVILTAVGVVGTVYTAYLTHKAAFKSAETIRQANLDENLEVVDDEDRISTKEAVKYVWKNYIPPVAAGATTVAAIVFSNRISTSRAAALAAAYSVSERAYSEYKDKVVEKLGVTKDQAVRDEVAQDRLKSDPVSERVVIMTDGGEVLCYDKMSGRYFKSSAESIQRAVNETNAEVLNNDYQTLTDFYDRLGLDANGFSDEVGWTSQDKLLVVRLSTMMADDGRPCIVMDYDMSANRSFHKSHP